MTYFRSFPTTTYANTQVVDLTRRAALRRSLVADSRAYLPYEVRAGMRADQVAEFYYGDPENVWMVYMSAGLVDPYHGWYMGQNDFEEHVSTKYGSQEHAIDRTHHWQLDWASDETELSPAAYQALDPVLKKYWEASYGQGANIISYTRRVEDWTASTNMVVRLEITPDGDGDFAPGDVLTFRTGGARTGAAEVAWANSSVVKVHHVRNEHDMAGQRVTAESGASAVVGDVRFVANTIPVDERPYWSRVSCYDHEFGLNESRKYIRLVDAKYTIQLQADLKKTLGGL
jgi:hypothetical protein